MIKRSPILRATALAFLVAQASAQEYQSVAVTSEPAGAVIQLNGTIVGTTPANIALPSGAGTSEIELSKDGYQDFSYLFSDDDIPGVVEAIMEIRRTVIPVTVADDREPAADGEITLREALEYASGRSRPVGSDRVLINGPVGAERADDIVVSTRLHPSDPVLTIKTPLPTFSGVGDQLVGPENRATIAVAHGFTIRGAGLVMGPDTSAERLIIDGFDIGLSAEGFGAMEARDVSAIGGFIGFSASQGAELLLSGADAINLAANTSAYDDGVIDGFVDDILQNDLENMTLFSGPSGEDGFAVLEGWIEPESATNLFVRQAQTRPLREVDGLVADTSSYDLYSIFGRGQSDQRWPRHVYDGIDGNYFRWSFKEPAPYEFMYVMGERPMRTDKFVLHHLQVDSKLVKYKFSLLGRGRKIIETFAIETNGLIDEITIDPEADFFGFQINVVEAIGTSPGITEIEADILDSDAYEPLSFSRRRAVFPRPNRGTRGLLEINGKLRVIGEEVFASEALVPFPQLDNAYRPVERKSLTLGQAATVQDFRDALDELANSDASELIISGTLDIDASLGPITLTALHLTGGGEIRSSDGSNLRFQDSRDIRLDNLTLTGGGLELQNSFPVVLEAMSIQQFDTAITAKKSRVVVANSSISGGNLAYQGDEGSLTMIDSQIEDVAMGLSARSADPMALIGNRILARDSAIDLRQEDYDLGVVNMVANYVEPAIPNAPVTAEYNFSGASLFGDNAPSNLGLTGKTYLTDINLSWIGSGIHDIRVGGEPTQVRLLEFGDLNIRCLLSADPSVPGVPKPLVLQQSATIVLHDTNASVLCQSGAGGGNIVLPAASQPGATIPAVARLLISLDGGLEDAEDGMTNSVVAIVTSEPIGSGQPFPALGSEGAADAKRRLIYSLIDAGDMAGGFSRSYDFYSRSPRDKDIAKLLIYAADSWAASLESRGLHDEALELLTDLADSDTAPSGAQALVVNTYLARGRDLTDLQEWEDARRNYRLALARDPALENAQQDIAYVYQEDLRSRFSTDKVAETIAWVETQSLEFPENADGLRDVADILLGNSVVEAIDNQRFEESVSLASAHLRWATTDKTINNMRVAFQNYAIDAVTDQQTDAVLETLRKLTDEHGAGLGLTGILGNVFNNVAVTAVEAGDYTSAQAAAGVLYDIEPTSDVADLLAFTYGRQAEAIEASGDIAGATQLLVEALHLYPDLSRLAEQGQSIGNRAGLAANDADDTQTAVDTLETTIANFGDSELLSQNLRVIYANWAVKSANAGDLDLALRVAEAGQKRFPDEATFAKVIDYVHGRQ